MIHPTLAQLPIHALFSSASEEWYTPSLYIEAARSLLGAIDLDPASHAEANNVVRASRFYTKEEDGLSLPFYGRVWLNPPYGRTGGKSSAGLWTKKLIHEFDCGHIEAAVLLVNADTDTGWFQPLWRFPVCFTSGRVNFYTFVRQHKYRNTHGSAFVYLGPYKDRFHDLFSPFGTIVKRVTREEAVAYA